MRTTTQFNLLDLPNELISHIIEFVDAFATLRRLSRTCHRVQTLAEPVLYRHISLRAGAGAKPKVLWKALQRRPKRALALRTLVVPCKAYLPYEIGTIADVTFMAGGLKELMLESPLCNETQFEDEKSWNLLAARLFHPFQAAVTIEELSTRPLQNLAKLTLHLNGPESPYWTLDERSLCLLLLPALQELRLSCMNLYGDLFEKTTIDTSISPLKRLVLEECNISHQGLKGLLSLPKALETLYIGENSHNHRQFPNIQVSTWCNHLFKTGPSATLEALAQQKYSLKSLVYVTPGNYYFRHRQRDRFTLPKAAPVDAGFADFYALEYIALHGTCEAFERAVLSSHPPPNLRDLTFQQDLNPLWPLGSQIDGDLDNAGVLLFIPFFRAPSSSIPSSLEIFNIVCEYSDGQQDIFVSEEARRSTIRRAAKAVSETHGVKLNVKYYYRSHYYPPFLHGEPQPEEGLIYDGGGDRFVEEASLNAGLRRGSVWNED